MSAPDAHGGSGPAQVARRLLVSGRVQGVGFRHATWRTASRSGLSGWVRNLPDGRVEVLLQGGPAAVQEVTEWIRRGGPPAGRVDRVQATEVPVDPALPEFDVRL